MHTNVQLYPVSGISCFVPQTSLQQRDYGHQILDFGALRRLCLIPRLLEFLRQHCWMPDQVTRNVPDSSYVTGKHSLDVHFSVLLLSHFIAVLSQFITSQSIVGRHTPAQIVSESLGLAFTDQLLNTHTKLQVDSRLPDNHLAIHSLSTVSREYTED